MKTMILFFGLIYSSSLTAAASKCSLLLSSELIPKQTREELSLLPKEFFNDAIPSVEFVRSVDTGKVARDVLGIKENHEEKLFEPRRQKATLDGHIRTGRAVEEIQEIMDKLTKKKGDYFFIGNGMHYLYNTYKYMNRASPKRDKLHRIDVSRALFEAPDFEQNIKKYFNSLGISSQHKGLVVLIDTLGLPKKDDHSLFQLAVRLTKHLVDEGLSLQAASKKVVVYGIPEGTGLSDGAKSISGFQSSLRNYISGKETKSFYYIADGSKDLKTMFVLTDFFKTWNPGKFSRFNESGQPVRKNIDITSNGLRVAKENEGQYYGVKTVKSYFYHRIAERLRYVIVMKALYDSVDQLK